MNHLSAWELLSCWMFSSGLQSVILGIKRLVTIIILQRLWMIFRIPLKERWASTLSSLANECRRRSRGQQRPSKLEILFFSLWWTSLSVKNICWRSHVIFKNTSDLYNQKTRLSTCSGKQKFATPWIISKSISSRSSMMYVIAIMTLILHEECNMMRSPLYQKAHLTRRCTSNTLQVLFVESGRADGRLLYTEPLFLPLTLPNYITEPRKKAPPYFVWKLSTRL